MDQCPFSKIVWFLISRKIVRSGTQGACWGKARKKFRHKTIDKDPLASAWLPPLYLYITSLFMCLLYFTGFSVSLFFNLQFLISNAMEMHTSFLLLQNIPSNCFLSLWQNNLWSLITFILFPNKYMMQSVQCQSQGMLITVNSFIFPLGAISPMTSTYPLFPSLLALPLSDLIMFFIFSLLFFHWICFIWWLLLFFYNHLTSVPCVVALQMSLSLKRMWLPFWGSILLLGCIVFKYYFI